MRQSYHHHLSNWDSKIEVSHIKISKLKIISDYLLNKKEDLLRFPCHTQTLGAVKAVIEASGTFCSKTK